MANNILIRGEAAIGQANQFVDYGKVIGQRLNIDSLIKQRKEKENQFITDVKNMPDFDYQILSDNMRDPITNALVQTKQSYINSARTLRDYSPNSQQYVDAVNQMNSAKRQFESMDGFVKLYNAGKIDYKESLADMSDGNHNKDRQFLAEIYNPNFKNITVENGEIFFNTEAAGKVSIKSLPDYFNKDGASMGEIENLYMDGYKGASKGNPYDDNIMLMGLNRILTNAGNEGKRSITFDYGVPSLDPSQPADITFASSARFKQLNDQYKGDYDTWAHDPANDTQLGNELNSWLRNAFKSSISTRYKSWKKDRDELYRMRYSRTGSGKDTQQEDFSKLINEIANESLTYLTRANQYVNFGDGSYEEYSDVDEEATQEKFALGLADTFNSNVYGSQNRRYLSKGQFKAILRKDSKIASDLPGQQGIEKTEANINDHLNKNYPDTYLFSFEEGDAITANTAVGVPTDYKNPVTVRLTTLFKGAGIKGILN
jgi:hypothetical protein